jgi:hypothetical protein
MKRKRLFIVTDFAEIEIDPIFWPSMNWCSTRLLWRYV